MWLTREGCSWGIREPTERLSGAMMEAKRGRENAFRERHSFLGNDLVEGPVAIRGYSTP